MQECDQQDQCSAIEWYDSSPWNGSKCHLLLDLLLLVGVLFWSPPRTLSVRRRGLVLRLLDATGKWCLVDTQMLVILMVALHLDVTLPSAIAIMSVIMSSPQ